MDKKKDMLNQEKNSGLYYEERMFGEFKTHGILKTSGGKQQVIKFV